MKLLYGIFLLFLCAAATSAFANDTREIELKDGTILTGEVVSLANGVYTIKSDSLGTLKVEESKVRSIRTKGPSIPAADTGTQIKALQDTMMNDKEIMGMIQSLRDDPDFRKILEDPEILKAVNSGDVAALTANPAFMKLLSNKTVQDIQGKVAK